MNLLSGRLCAALLVLLGGLLAACAWSVPADPGQNARRGRTGVSEPAATGESVGLPTPAGPDADPAAGSIYASRCAQCHEPIHPATYSAAEWPAYVDRYGPRAGLFGSERARVLSWLQAHGR